MCSTLGKGSVWLQTLINWLPGHPIANDYKYGGDLGLSCGPDPVPALEGQYTKMDWCDECMEGKRNTGHVTTQDLRATTIWLHAVRYTSLLSQQPWSFEAPPPSWSQF